MQALARLLLLGAWLQCVIGGRFKWDLATVGAASSTEAAGAPEFLPAATSVRAAPGATVQLECAVRRLGDRKMSWIRSRDMQILIHAGEVFTNSARVFPGGTAGAGAGAGVGRAVLGLRRLRASDAGRYECQLNTDPKMSLFYNLTVTDELPVPPEISPLGDGVVVVAPGATAVLGCQVQWPQGMTSTLTNIQWTKDGHPIQRKVDLYETASGDRSESRLALAAVEAGDAGAYACAAGAPAAAASVELRVTAEGGMEAMQRDAPAAGGARGGHEARAALLLAALLLRALCNT